jgi:hypothetical protein
MSTDENRLTPELREAVRFAAAVLRDAINTATNGDEFCAELLGESFHAVFLDNDEGGYEQYLAVIDAALAEAER